MAMNEELCRLASFASYPITAKARPSRLAKAGFFYKGEGDGTVCFKCFAQLDDWREFDDPQEKHKQISPHCPLVLGNDKENVQLQLLTDDANSYASSREESDNANFTTSIPSGILEVYNNALSRAKRLGVFRQTLSCSIDRNNPDFDKLRKHSVRLSTFDDWPIRAHAKPAELVGQGFFFTGIDDRVQCAFCRGFLRNWVPGDIPRDEHKKHFPECPFVRGIDVGNVLDETGEKQLVSYALTGAGPREDLELRETPFFDSQPLMINSTRPKHPEYAMEIRRIHSFRGGYVPRGQTIEVLAKAGFYYVGPHDNVRCFFCDGGLKNWQVDDDPWVEHGRWFPRCAYLATQRDQMFIEAAQVPRNRVLTEILPSNSVGRPLYVDNQSNNSLKTRIRQLYADLVSEIDPRGYIIDLLFQKEVISVDCRSKLINISTRQDRCRALLEQLLTGSHPQGCLFFREALKQHYPGLVHRIDERANSATQNLATQNVSSAAQHTIEPREVKARMDSPTVRAIVDMGYSRDMIKRAIERRLVTTGDDFPNAEALLEALFQLDESCNTSENKEFETGMNSGASVSPNAAPVTSPQSEPLPTSQLSVSLSTNAAADVAATPQLAAKPKRNRKKKKVPTATLR